MYLLSFVILYRSDINDIIAQTYNAKYAIATTDLDDVLISTSETRYHIETATHRFISTQACNALSDTKSSVINWFLELSVFSVSSPSRERSPYRAV